mgnify:CR=1 FL=1
MSTEKAALRKAIRARYPGKSQRDAESARLCAVIAQSDLFRRANVVAGYVPMAREADIMPLLRLTLDLGKMLLLPRVEGGRQMTMRQICDLSALIPGTYGIPEPPESAPILSPDAIELLLTPLEGVAPDGTRLGKGGGYYSAGRLCGRGEDSVLQRREKSVKIMKGEKIPCRKRKRKPLPPSLSAKSRI